MTERGEFLNLSAAAKHLGTSRDLVRRRVASGELPVFRDPRDARVKLVRVHDLRRFERRPRVGVTGEPAAA